MTKTIGYAATLLVWLIAAHASAAGIIHWQIIPDKSTLQWTATYGGKAVTGNFPVFTADVAFDAAHLDISQATIKIDTTKLKSADHDAQENLPLPDWFDSGQYPLATFQTTGFTHGAGNQYVANGTLTVRDKSVPVAMPLTIIFHDNGTEHAATIDGETTVKRTALGVGQGDWAATDSIADEVKITIRLEAKQAS